MRESHRGCGHVNAVPTRASRIANVATDAAADLVEQFQDLLKARHYEPVLASIAHLPKNELAHVASTLVNLPVSSSYFLIIVPALRFWNAFTAGSFSSRS